MEHKVPKFGIAKRQAGSAKGKIKISNDFDEPLECFKDYMPDDEFFVKIKDKFPSDNKFDCKEINTG